MAVGLGLLGFVSNIELDTYDLRVAATARPSAPADNIVLVAIDNDSIRHMEPLVGRWPWPRLVHATVIDYLAAAGAKVIGYDVLFAERDLRTFMVADSEWTGEESDAAQIPWPIQIQYERAEEPVTNGSTLPPPPITSPASACSRP